MQIATTIANDWPTDQYQLLDSGAEYKLERFGDYILARPDPQAVWQPRLSHAEWDQADATFSRERESNAIPTPANNSATPPPSAHWTTRHSLPASWHMHWQGLTLSTRLSPFKHTGIFPEQSAHWVWMRQCIQQAPDRELRLLNLFGYTGVASLVAAQEGMQVTHVDASPKTIEWARDNQELSGLTAAPIRWITDDSLKFVQREARRGSRYDMIVMDPPAFGRGPKGEVWKFETSLPQLLAACRDILSDRPIGLLLNSYSVRASSLMLGNLLADMLVNQRRPGTITVGELALPEAHSQRLLSTAIYARWTSGTEA